MARVSLNALMIAASNRLRDALALKAIECDVMDGPEPPNNAGAVFYAVHGGGGWNNPAKECLDERLGFRVTVSMRVADSPRDRTGRSRLALAKAGLVDRCNDVVAVLHGSYEVMNAANDLIGDAQGFVEPPRFRDAGSGDPTEVGPHWFGGQPSQDRLAGITLTLTFRDARRVRAIQNLTLVGLPYIRQEGGDGFMLQEDGNYVAQEGD